MKFCTTCGRTYTEPDVDMCPHDGTPLFSMAGSEDEPSASASLDEPSAPVVQGALMGAEDLAAESGSGEYQLPDDDLPAPVARAESEGEFDDLPAPAASRSLDLESDELSSPALADSSGDDLLLATGSEPLSEAQATLIPSTRRTHAWQGDERAGDLDCACR